LPSISDFYFGLSNSANPTDSKDKPNILFILADDLGYGDLSVYGQTDFQTPHPDQLARDGLRLTQAYANSAVCSAARFGLITGRYQYRLRGGLEEPIPGTKGNVGLPPSHPTLPSLLKKAGYRTAQIGKWHLGFLPMYGPLKNDYDLFFGNYAGYIDYFNHGLGPDEPDGLYEGEAPVREAGYYTDLLADRASDYLNKLDGDKPFFLSLHFTGRRRAFFQNLALLRPKDRIAGGRHQDSSAGALASQDQACPNQLAGDDFHGLVADPARRRGHGAGSRLSIGR
jgi:arylsulfatase A-like enzyme